VAADLKGLLVPVQAENMAAITEPVPIGQLLRRIEHYHGEPVTRLALNLSPYIFPRPIELRTMEWSRLTVDGPQPMWRVPWRRMKMKDPHLVPLSRQAVAILREVHLHTGGGQWVFPQLRKPSRPCPKIVSRPPRLRESCRVRRRSGSSRTQQLPRAKRQSFFG
jgi:integrase